MSWFDNRGRRLDTWSIIQTPGNATSKQEHHYDAER